MSKRQNSTLIVNKIKRPWSTVSSLTEHFFPMSKTGRVIFNPPWTSSSFILDSEKDEKVLSYLLVLLGCGFLLWELIWGYIVYYYADYTSFYWGGMFTVLCVEGIFYKEILAKEALKFLCKNKSSEGSRIPRNFIGDKRHAWGYTVFFSVGSFLCWTYSALDAYWQADSLWVIYAIVTSLFFVFCLILFWWLAKSLDFIYKLGLTVMSCLVAQIWCTGAYSYFKPGMPREYEGEWGEQGSLISQHSAYYFQESPKELDRRLTKFWYRFKDENVIWGCYSMRPAQFEYFRQMWCKGDLGNVLLDQLADEEINKQQAIYRFRRFYPRWWKPYRDCRYIFVEPYEKNVQNTHPSWLSESGGNLPSLNEKFSLTYDVASERCFVEWRIRKLPPVFYSHGEIFLRRWQMIVLGSLFLLLLILFMAVRSNCQKRY